MRSSKAVTFISLLLLLGALLPATVRAFSWGDLFGVISGTAEAKMDSADTPNASTNVQMLGLRSAINSNPAPARGGDDITIVNGTAVAADEGPSGTMADIEKPKNSTVSIYIVREGDTVQSVAKMFKVSEGTILSFNDLARGATLKHGQEIIIMPTTEIKYTVKKGDTLEAIAKATGGDANEIAVHNGIDNTTLAAGQEIRVPNGEVPAIVKSSIKKPGTTAPSTIASGKNSGYYKSPLSSYKRTQGIHGYNGVDLGAPLGTPIRAAASGDVTVARTGGWNGGYGNYVVISHSNGSQTLYGHMSKVATSAGAHVSQGDVIGYVGHSGQVSGPTGNHLHFEIRNGNRNPF